MPNPIIDPPPLQDYHHEEESEQDFSGLIDECEKTSQAATIEPKHEEDECSLQLNQQPNDYRHINTLEDTLTYKLSLSLASAMYLPITTCKFLLLGVVSSIASKKYCVIYRDKSPLPLGLYIAAEQPTGASKTRLLEKLESPIFSAIKEARKEVNAALAKSPKEEKQKKKSTKKEGQEADRKNMIIRNKLASVFSPIKTNATPESIDKGLNDTGGFYTIISSEKGAINTLLGIAYTSENNSNNNDLLLKSFTGDWYASSRVSRTGYDGFVAGTIICFAQDGTINSILAESKGSGISERFFLIAEPHNLGNRNLLDLKEVNKTLFNQYSDNLKNLTKETVNRDAKAIISAVMNDAPLEDTSYRDKDKLCIKASGWKLIAEYRQIIEPLLADREKYSHEIMRGAAAKTEQQIMKIASILQIIETDNERVILTNIDDIFIKIAIKLVSERLSDLYDMLIKYGVIGKTAEQVAVLNGFERYAKRTVGQIINSRRRVAPFKGMQRPAEKIKKTLQELEQSGLLKNIGTKTYQLIE
jgi:hypothetical protein